MEQTGGEEVEFDAHQLAYCGIYCPQCSFRVVYETQNREHVLSMPSRYDRLKDSPMDEYACECCKGDNICGPCEMRDCAADKKIDSCAECAEFPCERIVDFDEDDSPHHSTAVENLRRIKAVGYERWFEGIRDQMQCACGARLSWYLGCPECGMER